jgi:hypothetical protein
VAEEISGGANGRCRLLQSAPLNADDFMLDVDIAAVRILSTWSIFPWNGTNSETTAVAVDEDRDIYQDQVLSFDKVVFRILSLNLFHNRIAHSLRMRIFASGSKSACNCFMV